MYWYFIFFFTKVSIPLNLVSNILFFIRLFEPASSRSGPIQMLAPTMGQKYCLLHCSIVGASNGLVYRGAQGGDTWNRHALALVPWEVLHARIQKVLSAEVQLWQRFFLIWWGEEGSKYHYKRAIIIECWLGSFVVFKRIWISIAKKPYIFVIFRGGGVRTPAPPPSGSAHALASSTIGGVACVLLQDLL